MTTQYDWQLYPQAEAFLQSAVFQFFAGNGYAANLASKIEQQTSTRFVDWIDHLALPEAEVDVEELLAWGYKEIEKENDLGVTVFQPVGSVLFPVLLKKDKPTELALITENIEDFKNAHPSNRIIEGKPNAPFRKLVLSNERGFLFSAVERRGDSGYAVEDSNDIPLYMEACQVFNSRVRMFSSEEEGLKELEHLIKDLLCTRISKSRLADAFFRAERQYWESRNNTARLQKSRQDKLGLGWGNVDHHTFRSSRKNFAALIRVFEQLGLASRERFNAGVQAGWGAQILEEPAGRNVVFADVDLAAEEKEADFAHSGLEPRDKLGTVGLWVGLHGESILEAGMHHLAARFRFDDFREELNALGGGLMNPFSNFSFLKQAFTEPELWQVNKERVDLLEKKQQLSQEQAAKFIQSGAIGSHMENIQRNQGFKGFNQNSVSAIIKWTDPRVQAEKYA